MFLLLREEKEIKQRPPKPCTCGEEQKKSANVAMLQAERKGLA